MPHNELLSFAIPTYNRAVVWRELLPELIEQCRPHNAAIYISDNASSDDTQDVILAAQKEYPYIYYSRNDENLGVDLNFEKALKMPDSRYVWFKGDDERVINNGVEKVLEIVSKADYDMVVTNAQASSSRILNDKLKTQVFTDPIDFFEKTLSMTTFMSILIFNKKLIEQANFRRFYGLGYTHTAIMYEHLATCSGTAISINLAAREFPEIYGTRNNQKGMAVFYEQTPLIDQMVVNRIDNPAPMRTLFLTFSVFVTDSVLSLPPQIPLASKLKVLSHYKRDYGLSSLISHRAAGVFDIELARKCKNHFRYVSRVPYFIILLISVLPKAPLRPIVRLRRYLRKKTHEFLAKIA
ncbi:glycosyl transferase [Campylobacterota bacterium]|nr:glycosyl transferase [Campylobacterota bacterium]